MTTIAKLRAADLTEVRFDCRRCDRVWVLLLDELETRFGDGDLGPVFDILKSDCDRHGETRIYELCQLACPTLLVLAGLMPRGWVPDWVQGEPARR